MDFPKNALNAYLFNVEYGYAPKDLKECKKNSWFSANKVDSYWTDNQNDIRVIGNLVEMETLNKKYKKESLKNKLKSILIKYQKGTKFRDPQRDYIPRVKELLKSISKEKLECIDVPFYCNDGKKYFKKGTYEVTKLAEILYVTQFENKLYHLERIFRDDVYQIDEENFDFVETFKKIYDDYEIKLEGDIDIYNIIEDKDWDSEERKTQREERDKFNKYMESIYEYVPMRRWKSISVGRIKKKVNWLAIENQIKSYYLFNNVLSGAFDKAATEAGWVDIETKWIKYTFIECVKNEVAKRSSNNGIKQYIEKLPDKTPEQLKTMMNFLDEFDYKKIDIEVDEKFVRQYVKDYTYDMKFTVDADWLLAHDEWLYERSKSFVGPLTVKKKGDGKIEFFGGILLQGLSCNACRNIYGDKHTFTGKQLDIKTYKYENYFVLKNLIPEELWDQAEVNEIKIEYLGEPDYRHTNFPRVDQRPVTIPKEPDSNKYKPSLKF